MPEGPEIRNIYEFIKPFLENKIIKSFEVLSGKYVNKGIPNIEKVRNIRILNILLKGKTIFLRCENEISIVFVHGMTGSYSVEAQKHSRICLDLISFVDTKFSSSLYYNDTRNFGTCTIYTTSEDFDKAWNNLGPDILNTEVSYKEFYFRISKKPNMKIGIALLDQKLISGIGNYLRCDILWYTKIHHETQIKNLTEEKKVELYNACLNIVRYHADLSHSLELLPKGDFFVYMQKYDIFNNKVIREKFNGRTIHYVIKKVENEVEELSDNEEIVIIQKRKSL